MINKVLAASITVAFVGAVRPDPGVDAIGYGVVAIMMYEGLSYCINYIRKQHKKKVRKHYIAVNLKARKEDGERLDEMVFNPFKNVKSEVI